MSADILVVDDEEDMPDLFLRQFRHEIKNGKYQFHFAASGEAAIEFLVSFTSTELVLILSDINMPGMTGMELLARVHVLKPELPVAMITAYGDEASRAEALKMGAVDFLSKPIDFDDLRERLPDLAAAGGGQA